ncbi:Na+-transporting NADH:ubiquinone oxidoreductase subunit F [Alteromonas aestuariivivens]|uniref:Na+-transporting NADH:ubiquinone oxidoreductase subunit F n=1 Tax=Alteromonas aestuariivivens TaxID=1938339 RepID=A0A3D8MEY9_9ALTE|nr:2Fe-2S iron-sulfur cluster binding domain-containing protein [Alteromonas aestuariivivens]RDV29131.1 Na+-transporting NADH:ubiquinone oxidoreductase subunit F [Alteromonas aestuariivivens]
MQWIRKIHKWASLVVGMQFLLWLGSGLYFNLMDHHKVGGHTYRSHAHHEPGDIDVTALVEPKAVLQRNPKSVVITQIELLGQPYYLLTHKLGLYRDFENDYSLVDAYSGERVDIDASFATRLARQSYNGPGAVDSVTLLQPPLEDFPKQKNATWRVNFADDIDTSVYIEAGSGRVVGHSDAHKRLADIFFMLHFMDYGNEGSFNNIQIILFAFITLWLALTGLIWTVDLAFRGQYKVAWLSATIPVKIFDQQRRPLWEVELSSATNILDGLAEHGIALPSTCGGGGTCGRCKVLINPSTEPTSADHEQFSVDELEQGFRLACQHFSTDVQDMTLFDVTDAKKVTLELTNSRFVSSNIKELRFKVIGNRLTYKAGAFVRFFIPHGHGDVRPKNIPHQYAGNWEGVPDEQFERHACLRSYSLASDSHTSEELVFAIKYQRAPEPGVPAGVGSSYLCNMEPGQRVDAMGPFEDFYAEPDYSGPMILIGAGSGMAPLRSIILERLRVMKSTQPINFYFGARTEEDLLYQQEFFALSRKFSNFHFTPVLSRASDDWLGATGYAQQVLFANSTTSDLLAAKYFICGPAGMMDDAMNQLRELGVEAKDLYFDSFA